MDRERLPLREWRLRRFLTQDDLARATGLTQFTISQIELGRSEPRPATRRKLCEVLGVEGDQILYGPDAVTPERRVRKPATHDTEDEQRPAA